MKHTHFGITALLTMTLCGTAAAQYNIPTIDESRKLTTDQLWGAAALLGETLPIKGEAVADENASPIPGSPNTPRVTTTHKVIVKQAAGSKSSSCGSTNSCVQQEGCAPSTNCDPEKGCTPQNNSCKQTPVTAKSVPDAIPSVNFLSGTPDQNASYYIYLQSASWCGPCRSLMPKIVREYKKMRKAGVEVILIGCDRDEASCKAYLKKYKAEFPAVLSTDRSVNVLPGIKDAGGIPHATIVDRNGKQLQDGHGSIALDWKSICK